MFPSSFIYARSGASLCTVCSNSYLGFDTDISTAENAGFRILPIKCDMRLTLILCYNQNASPERKQLFQKIAKDLR